MQVRRSTDDEPGTYHREQHDTAGVGRGDCIRRNSIGRCSVKRLLALVLMVMGCAFATELVDVDVSKFPPNIVRKSSTTENAVPKVNNTTNTLVNSRITDTGSGAVAIAAPSVSLNDSNASHTVTLTPGDESDNRVLSIPVLGAAAKVNVSTATQTANYLQKATADGVLANGAITDDGTTVTLTGTAGTVLRESPAAAATTTAGNAITVQASPAIAGTVTAGAAAGGSVNITAGAAARLTSGNAAGGNIVLTPGAGIGTGSRGSVLCPGSGTNSTAIGGQATNTSSVVIGVNATVSGYEASGFGYQCSSTGIAAAAFGKNATASQSGTVAFGAFTTASGSQSVAIGGADNSSGRQGVCKLDSSCNIPKLHLIRNDSNEAFNSGNLYATLYAGSESVLFTNELDVTQAAIANGSSNWTVTVGSNWVTVNTITAHKFSVGQYISTDADWTDNAFMASLTDKLITVVTSTTFSFALTQANQAATTETNAGAGITPGDYVITMPTGGTFFVDEIGVVASSATAVVTQPTIQFGNSGDRDAFYAPAITTLLTAVRTREVLTPIAVAAGQTTLSAGMTTAGNGTAYKIRFYWKGIFVEDE